MISTNKFLNLLKANDEEVENIINKMSESDAKSMLSLIIKQMNNERRGISDDETKSVTNP